MPRTKEASWKKLDNAALIFPSSSTKANTYVFRFSCELMEEINPEILQKALLKTRDLFPLYNTVLKRGLFWYYLEETSQIPQVFEENLTLCSPLFLKEQKTLLYRVMYFKTRISLEVYHVLSDGTGAIQFLKCLVSNYLMMMSEGKLSDVSSHFIGTELEQQSDSFSKYYKGKNKNKEKKNRIYAYQLKGDKYTENRISLIEAILPVDKVLEKAHDFNTTLTVFLSSVLIMAIQRAMPIKAMKKAVMLTIPVNLRRYFSSETTRNFFSIIHAGLKLTNSEEVTLEKVIYEVDKCFKDELVYDKLYERLNSLSAIERNVFVRIAPLIIKDVTLHYANRLSHRESTASLSNVGVINMPEEYCPFIRQFNVSNSTDCLQACVCSFENKLSISVMSCFKGRVIEKNFFRILSELGLSVEISANSPEVEL